MTDAELSTLEAAAKAATPGPWMWDEYGNYDSAGTLLPYGEADCRYIAEANPAAILELIEELQQTRKERDWVIQNIRPTDVGPTACPTKEIWYNCDEGLETPRNKDVCHKCWLDAAKEATCQK